jgi:carboxyl-terminal processing protease
MRSMLDVASLLLPKGRIATVRQRNYPDEGYDCPQEEPRHLRIPLVCLVNGESSSASEIVAGCLQDHKRATILGERTQGKGSVQILHTLGEKQLLLTTAIFLRPSGKKLDKCSIKGHGEDEWGVTPDQVLKLASEEQSALVEAFQRQEVIGAAKEAKPFKDRQLELALESLREQLKKQ